MRGLCWTKLFNPFWHFLRFLPIPQATEVTAFLPCQSVIPTGGILSSRLDSQTVERIVFLLFEYVWALSICSNMFRHRKDRSAVDEKDILQHCRIYMIKVHLMPVPNVCARHLLSPKEQMPMNTVKYFTSSFTVEHCFILLTYARMFTVANDYTGAHSIVWICWRKDVSFTSMYLWEFSFN